MKVILLAGKGEFTSIVYNKLIETIKIDKVILEDSESTKIFLKRRVKKLGYLNVLGQIMFKVICVPVLNLTSKNRISEIKKQYALDDKENYLKDAIFVNSSNSIECIETIKQLNPDIIIVNGTRILSKKLLDSTRATIINMHLGITPKYRGVHGAYWAYYNNDDNNAGVTVHLIDPGIDTGGILYQDVIYKTIRDNFVTYPYIQTAIGIDLEIKAIKDIEKNNIKIIKNELESNLYYHPTICQYVKGLIRGVK